MPSEASGARIKFPSVACEGDSICPFHTVIFGVKAPSGFSSFKLKLTASKENRRRKEVLIDDAQTRKKFLG